MCSAFRSALFALGLFLGHLSCPLLFKQEGFGVEVRHLFVMIRHHCRSQFHASSRRGIELGVLLPETAD